MAANVETMFYVRETPWHGLGTRVLEAPSSQEALRLSGLDWNVIQEAIYTKENERIPAVHFPAPAYGSCGQKTGAG